ncbi:phage tail assembly chaperone [Burkholderia oklahomensis]|uniref:Caudovirales tail fibre assembly protein n=1 Tax=Burkholderia oklahomensis TaxID=342113 RepID=A0AAI8BD19_9BURK|nr:phage tail assembly chaperone [Burkholderia oklahomensis]AIO69923.1 hypothetical protein DM82_4370 [Burkholderia oklahomensis]AOI40088.1 hypothetical protein WG70_11020 [Burkholderia oklahomensis EO147]KUY68354.1 hypothetical protein WG70_25140 [Burkholderia oklahomensis EO147]QPS39540.1 hypothetical protein I6G57_27270 [Burkholderia oklahomensis]
MAYTNEHMVFTLMEMYPHLAHWKDYKVAHPCCPVSGEQNADPWIVEWTAPDVKPRAEWVLDYFHEHEEEICAKLARYHRDDKLRFSDQFASLPSDAPPYLVDRHAKIVEYRAKLRDIENLPGWPLEVEWPEFPQ